PISVQCLTQNLGPIAHVGADQDDLQVLAKTDLHLDRPVLIGQLAAPLLFRQLQYNLNTGLGSTGCLQLPMAGPGNAMSRAEPSIGKPWPTQRNTSAQSGIWRLWVGWTHPQQRYLAGRDAVGNLCPLQ